MISPEVLFSPLAIAGAVAGVLIAVVAGRVRREAPAQTALTAAGSGLALAALAWANHYGSAPLFSALAVGLGATLWTMGTERGRRPTIR